MNAGGNAWDVFRSGPSGLRVVVVPDARAAASLSVAPLQGLLARPGPVRVGLATGATFGPVFDEIARLERDGLLDLGRVAFTHLDEHLGVGPDDAGGMAREVRARLLDRLRVPPAAFLAVDARGASEADAVARHRVALEAFGRIDLQYLGIGRNGHAAFNEPGTPFGHGVHVAGLAPSTKASAAPRFRDGLVPDRALTAGPATILDAAALWLVATGAAKAETVRDLLEGPVTTDCPATLVRLHPDATVVLDRDAASLLGVRARWVPEALPPALLSPADLRPAGPVVVVSPHPDDASISCGGLIASLPREARRVIVTMTTGSRAVVPGAASREDAARIREDEVRAEAETLAAEALFLRSRYYDSGAFEESDVRALADVLEGIAPAWILGPSLADPHPTHRLTRQVLDEAVRAFVEASGRPVEVWTFEGPWFQHRRDRVNAFVLHDAAAEAAKLAAVRAHRSQLARVPFDEGARALARLRAVGISESHLGGKVPGRIRELPLVEAYVRETYPNRPGTVP